MSILYLCTLSSGRLAAIAQQYYQLYGSMMTLDYELVLLPTMRRSKAVRRQNNPVTYGCLDNFDIQTL